MFNSEAAKVEANDQAKKSSFGSGLRINANASRRPTARSARRLFYHSMIYLALLFAIMAIDRVTGL